MIAASYIFAGILMGGSGLLLWAIISIAINIHDIAKNRKRFESRLRDTVDAGK